MTSGPSTLFSRLHALLWRGVMSRVQTDRLLGYLTFDDGPSCGLPEVLDLLDRTGSKATFFFRADRVEQRVELALSVLASGHTVGCHGYAHLSAWRKRGKHLEADLQQSLDVFMSRLGTRPSLVRPPYGRLRPTLLRSYRDAGVRPVLWDVDPVDYQPSRDCTEVCRAMGKWIRPGSVILLHDGARAWESGFAELEDWIRSRKDDGWMFESLTPEIG